MKHRKQSVYERKVRRYVLDVAKLVALVSFIMLFVYVGKCENDVITLKECMTHSMKCLATLCGSIAVASFAERRGE